MNKRVLEYALSALLLSLFPASASALCQPYAVTGEVFLYDKPAIGANIILNNARTNETILSNDNTTNRFYIDLAILQSCAEHSDLFNVFATMPNNTDNYEHTSFLYDSNETGIDLKQVKIKEKEKPAPTITIIDQIVFERSELTVLPIATNPNYGELLWKISDGPKDCSINENTGEIKWTPQETGTYEIKISVNDGFNEAHASFKVNVLNSPEIEVKEIPKQHAFTEQFYSYTISADGGRGKLTYSSSNEIPDFLSINSQSGLIYGTPSLSDVAQYSFRIFVKDEANEESSTIMNIQVVKCTDSDEDTYYFEGGICGEKDCNDDSISIHPKANEIFNLIDDNCNDAVDEKIVVGNPTWKDNANPETEYKADLSCENLDWKNCIERKEKILVSIFVNNTKTVEFDWEPSKEPLILEKITIKHENNPLHGVIINGHTLTDGATKKLFIRKTQGINTLCIKDAEVQSFTEVSPNCNMANEFLLECNGTSIEKYACNIIDNGNTYAVEGLSHSAAIEINTSTPPIPPHPAKKSSSSSSSSRTADITCSQWSSCKNSLQNRICKNGFVNTTEYKNCTSPNPVASNLTFSSEMESNVSHPAISNSATINSSSLILSSEILENTSIQNSTSQNNALLNYENATGENILLKSKFSFSSLLLSTALMIVVLAGVIAGYLSFKEHD